MFRPGTQLFRGHKNVCKATCVVHVIEIGNFGSWLFPVPSVISETRNRLPLKGIILEIKPIWDINFLSFHSLLLRAICLEKMDNMLLSAVLIPTTALSTLNTFPFPQWEKLEPKLKLRPLLLPPLYTCACSRVQWISEEGGVTV